MTGRGKSQDSARETCPDTQCAAPRTGLPSHIEPVSGRNRKLENGEQRLAPHIHSANLFAVLLVADLFEPVDILSAQRFLNGDMRVSRRATKATAMHSVPIIRRKSAQFPVALSRSYAERFLINPLTLVRMMTVALGSRIQAFPPRSKCSLL